MKALLLILVLSVLCRADVVSQLEAIRKTPPPPSDAPQEQQGHSIDVGGGKFVVISYLNRIARSVAVTSKSDLFLLLSYARDPDVQLRYIAIRALENELDKENIPIKAATWQITSSFDHPEYMLLVKQYTDGLVKLQEATAKGKNR